MWHVSAAGVDSEDCSVPDLPCATLTHTLLNNYDSFDELHIHTEPGEPHVLYLCMDASDGIDMEVIVKGIGDVRPVITCDLPEIDFSILNVVYFPLEYEVPARDNYVRIENVDFQNGDIVVEDANLAVKNCTFRNSSIYVMSANLRLIQTGKRATTSSLLDEWNMYVIDELSESGSWPEEFCVWSNLVITDSEWAYLNQTLESIVINSANINGIKVACDKLSFRVTNSVFWNQFLEIYTWAPAVLSMVNTTIQGVENETLIPGGLKIVTYNPPMVTIDSCTFMNLAYGDVVLSIFAKFLAEERAPLMWHLYFRAPYDDNPDNLYAGFNISNTLFLRNYYAIRMQTYDENTGVVNINIADSKFIENEGISDGGAILITTEIIPTVNIQRCSFLNNVAGTDPFLKPVLESVPYTLSLRKTLQFQRYTRTSFEHIDLRMTRLSGQVSHRFKYQLSGSGGAIYCSHCDVTIVDTTFVDNSASQLGGSILSTYNGKLKLTNVIIVTPASAAVHALQGTALHSDDGELTFQNVSIQCNSEQKEVTTLVQHLDNQESDSAFVYALDVACPPNTPLHTKTSSASVFSDFDKVTQSEYISYRRLVFACKRCEEGFYTLGSGILSVSFSNVSHVESHYVNTNTTQSTEQLQFELQENYNHTHVKCLTCPFGGQCDDGRLTTKPRYWGLERDGEVTMYRCPASYSCTKNCSAYNQCAAHRVGTLCGRCEPGYTEATFSTKCIPRYDCNDQWFFLVIMLYVTGYTCFLLFQNDLKTFIVGKPLGKATFWHNIKMIKITKDKVPTLQLNKDEGGVFLILLFYYFQDASIIQFEPIYRSSSSELNDMIRRVVQGLFKFRLDIFQFAKTICVYDDINPLRKQFAHLSVVPLIWLNLLAIFLVFCLINRKKKLPQIWFTRCVVALMLSVLFSYQKILSTAFSLIYCVTVQDKKVLFLDGNVDCFTLVQKVTISMVVTSIVPFVFYLTFAPDFLQQKRLSTFQFFLGCFLPIPVAIYMLFRRRKAENTPQVSSAANSLFTLLQGPYRPLSLPKTQVSLCWSGILLYRRLGLIIVRTTVHDPLLRLSIMSLICLIAQLKHVAVQPCHEKRANLSGTVSCTALMTIAVINTLNAAFESMEITPTGLTLSIMNTLATVEDCLLIWIPLVGICILVTVLLIRLVMLGATNSTTFKVEDKGQLKDTETKQQPPTSVAKAWSS